MRGRRGGTASSRRPRGWHGGLPCRAFSPNLHPSACGARADARVFQFGDGCGLLEVGEGVGIVDDVLAVEGVGGGGELVERGFPLGEDFAGELGDVGRRLLVVGCWLLVLQEGVGAGEGIERGGDHQLQIALGEDDVGVLPIEDLALLGDAQLAGKAVDGLGEDGAVGGAAAAAYGASAAVEEAEADAARAGYLMQRAMRLPYLPCAGDHAAILVGVGVAEHDFLLVVPGREQGL